MFWKIARLPAALSLCSFLTAWGQSPPAPAFEVASVKLTSHGRTADGWSFSDIKMASPGRLVGTNSSLDECIRWAYRVKEYQVSGPEWLNSDAASYDIEAKAPPETSEAKMRQMLQTLLGERFHLKLHRESKTIPVYDLVVGKKGPRLEEAKPDAKTDFWSEGGRAEVRIHSEKATLEDLANRLTRDLDHPVFDKTDLKGAYAFQLKWAREGEGPSVFTALEETCGLKLQPAKAPIEVLVIDHAERIPAEN